MEKKRLNSEINQKKKEIMKEQNNLRGLISNKNEIEQRKNEEIAKIKQLDS